MRTRVQSLRGGNLFRCWGKDAGAQPGLAHLRTLGSPAAHPNLALVSRAQGSLTLKLGLERGELGADFCFLGALFRGVLTT